MKRVAQLSRQRPEGVMDQPSSLGIGGLNKISNCSSSPENVGSTGLPAIRQKFESESPESDKDPVSRKGVPAEKAEGKRVANDK